MKANEILTAAANLLETKGWTQDAFARDANGKSIKSHEESAVCFCTIGALNRASGENVVRRLDTEGNRAYEHLRHSIGGWGVAEWNDSYDRTKEDVISTLRNAAETYKE